MSASQISHRLTDEVEKTLINGIPFPYLLGESEFYGRHFHVNSHVLIPRPETELLVDMIVQKKKKYDAVADVGVGSGVILLSLLLEKVATSGDGFDLSEKALHVAKMNASNLRVNNAQFHLSDRLTNCSKSFDLIVSNPPYIKTSAHRPGVHEKVDAFEPALALYIPDDDYENWFREFFQQVQERLHSDGEFYMEGHEAELQTQKEWLTEAGLKDVEVIKDWTRRERFLFGRKA